VQSDLHHAAARLQAAVLGPAGAGEPHSELARRTLGRDDQRGCWIGCWPRRRCATSGSNR
jgi:hypothetical protein